MLTSLFPRPSIDCFELAPFVATDLAAVRDAFRGATPVPLQQAWLPALEPAFAPASVRTGWRGASFFVFAELTDRDVFTRATSHNDRFWMLGDTFEIFFRPPHSQAYVELHVAPNNLRLQLRFDRPPVAGDPDPFATALVAESIFDSHTWVTPGGWAALAEIPAASAGHGHGLLPGARWAFSFGRYDYTRNIDPPVLSSSSPHTRAAFHHPDEWGTLFLRGPASI